MIIRNPVLVISDIHIIDNETDMRLFLSSSAAQDNDHGQLIRYIGPTGVYENGAYYKVVADEVTE